LNNCFCPDLRKKRGARKVNLKKNRVGQDKGNSSGYRYAANPVVTGAFKVFKVNNADNLINLSRQTAASIIPNR
jgi:hypothetical protein